MTRYVSAERLDKDDFGVPFTHAQGEVVYDAKTRLGPWATMTATSFHRHTSGSLGVGLGQKYVRDEHGQLWLTSGGKADGVNQGGYK